MRYDFLCEACGCEVAEERGPCSNRCGYKYVRPKTADELAADAPPPPAVVDFHRTDVAGVTLLVPVTRTADAWLRARAYDQWRYAGALVLEPAFRARALRTLDERGFTIAPEATHAAR